MYPKQDLLDSIQRTLDRVWGVCDDPFVLLGGDFNQLPDSELQALGLCTEFNAPTHAGHSLDRIYVSEPHYQHTFAFASSILTKHKAVVAQNKNSGLPTNTDGIEKYKFIPFRRRSPGQHAALLKYLQTYSWEFILEEQDTQTVFDSFYNLLWFHQYILSRETYVKIKPTDPSYMTPQIKLLLLEKSKLLRKGEMSAAASIANRIGQLIASHNSKSFDSGIPRVTLAWCVNVPPIDMSKFACPRYNIVIVSMYLGFMCQS